MGEKTRNLAMKIALAWDNNPNPWTRTWEERAASSRETSKRAAGSVPMMIKRQDKFRALDGKGSLSKQLSIQSTQPLHDAPWELLIRVSGPLNFSRMYSGRRRRGLHQSPQRSKTPSLILFRFSTFSAGTPPTLHLSRRHRHSGPANGDSAHSPDSRWQ